MEILHKKVEKIKDIIGKKLERQRELGLKRVTKMFSKELKEIRDLNRKIDGINKTIERKLPVGYRSSGSTINNMGYYNDELIPVADRRELRKASELLSIDRKEEAEQILSRLVKKYKIGQ